MTKPPRAKRLGRILGLLFLSIFVGFVVGGWILDERPPRDRDLRPPEPLVGGDDPFLQLIDHPPERVLSTLSVLSQSENVSGLGSDYDDVRRASRRWLGEFDRLFGRVGGDPRALTPDLFSNPELGAVWKKGPFPFEKLLRTASRVERHFDDADQALFSLSVALRLESWQAIYHPESSLRSLYGILEELTDAVESGVSQRVEDRRVIDGLIAWYPSVDLQRARFKFHYFDRKQKILETDHWRLILPKDTPAHRIKEQRTLRRFGEAVRERLEDPLDLDSFETPTTSALTRIWIDPHGDKMLDLELGYLDDLCDELVILDQRATLIRIALALLLREQEWERLPETLDELVPDYLAELPPPDQRPNYDREQRRLEFMHDRPWKDHRLQLPGPSR